MAQLTKRRNSRQDSNKPPVGDSARSGSLRLGMGAKRLQPNEPLHMTTRAASLASSVANAASGPASNGSRRSSSGETTRSVGGDDLDSDRPAKLAKVSSNYSVAPSQQSTPPLRDSPQLSRTRSGGQTANQDSIEQPGSDDEAQDGAASDAVPSRLSDNDNQDNDDEDSADDQNHNNTEEIFKPTHNLRVLRGSTSQSELRRNRENNLNPGEIAQNNDRQSVEAEESGGGILKRMPGRRRAPHPDLSIEVDLRRQLELKVAYRAVVKALKPILIELADRTKNHLQESNESHQQFEEYEEVISDLNERLRQRKELLQAEFREEQARLERDYEARKFIAEKKFDHYLRDRRDDYLLKCQNKCLSILNDAEKEDDSDATEYEDGIVPKLYHVNLDGSRSVLAEEYDSRSRIYVETGNKWEDMVTRCEFRETQKEFDESSCIRKPRGFAVYDGRQRQIAEAYANMHHLADASRHVEREAERASQKARHEAATGLHALADAMKMKSPVNLDVKPNIDSLRTPKTQSAQTSASPMTREKSARRRRPPVKPQPFPAGNMGPEPSSNVHQPRPDMQSHSTAQPPPIHYPQEPSLPPIHSELGHAPPSKASPRTEAIPPYRPWPPRDVHEQANDMYGARPGQQPPHPNDMMDPNVHPNDEYSRQNRRRRPGPRAFFAHEESNHNPQASSQHAWEPFTNSMGPPTYLPSYVKSAELNRGGSPTESPIRSAPAPAPPSADWPGFSNNSMGGPGRAPGIDRQAPYGPSFPGSATLGSGSQALPSPNRPPLNTEPLPGWRRANSPEHRPGEQSPRNTPSSQPPAYQPSPQAYSSYPQQGTYYGSYRQFSQPPSNMDRPVFSSSNQTSLPPLLPHPYNQPYSSNRPTSTLSPQIPSLSVPPPDSSNESSQRQSYHNHNRHSSQQHPQPPASQPPYNRQASYSSHGQESNYVPIQPHGSVPQTQTPMDQYPGQIGHQKILPATLDPARRSTGPQNPSPSTRPMSASITPTEAEGPNPGQGSLAPPPPTATSLQSSPRTGPISPSTATSPRQPQGQHYGYLPVFTGTGTSQRQPSVSTTPAGPNPGRPLQPTPPQQYNPASAEPPPPHHQQSRPPYGYSPYAPIAPAPGPGPGPGSGPSPVQSSPPGPPPAPGQHYGHSGSPPSTPSAQPRPDHQPGSEATGRPNADKMDNQKDKRGGREKEWKFTSSRWG